MVANQTTNESCLYEPMNYLEVKFILVGVIGTSVAIVGMITNLLALFALRPNINFLSPSPLIYLFVIGVLDFLFMWIYILVLSVEIYFDEFSNFTLYIWWNWYMPVLLAIGKIIQTSSTFLLVSASIERFLDVSGWEIVQFHNSHRLFVIGAVLLISSVFRGVSLWELEVIETPKCENFAKFSVGLTQFGKTIAYRSYCFYGVNMFHIFLPFSLLITSNCATVFRMRKAIRTQRDIFGRHSIWECGKKERNLLIATKMLISAVLLYLISNVLNFLITCIEYVDMELLRTQYPKFYTLSVDVIGLLQVGTAAVRLLICTVFSDKLRRDLCGIIKKERHGRII